MNTRRGRADTPLLMRIRSEFHEMPGLCLTVRQAARLWNVDVTTSEQALKSMGDSSLGIITAWHYEYTDKAPKNVAFVKLFNEMHKRNPDFFSVGGYDGMHVIYEAVKKAGGKTDGDSLIAAAKGLKWDSPRGPMSIDPETRDVVQTIYIRKVEKVDGQPQNVAFDKVENVKDPAGERRKK